MGINSNQGLLQEVFRLRRTMTDSCEAMSVVGAQMKSKAFQKLVIRSCIAVETGGHQSSKFEFVKMSGFVHLSAAVEGYAIAEALLR